jgi:hypothetical protein
MILRLALVSRKIFGGGSLRAAFLFEIFERSFRGRLSLREAASPSFERPLCSLALMRFGGAAESRIHPGFASFNWPCAAMSNANLG